MIALWLWGPLASNPVDGHVAGSQSEAGAIYRATDASPASPRKRAAWAAELVSAIAASPKHVNVLAAHASASSHTKRASYASLVTK
jgi:hypothetical protein